MEIRGGGGIVGALNSVSPTDLLKQPFFKTFFAHAIL